MTDRPPSSLADLLSQALADVQLAGAVFCCAALGDPWAVTVEPQTAGILYAPVDGSCAIERPGCETVDLAAGEIAFLLRAGVHAVRGATPTTPVTLDTLLKGGCETPGRLVRHGGGGAVTRLVVGWIEFADQVDHPLLADLPDLLVLPADEDVQWRCATLEALIRETTSLSPGGEALGRRLTEALFISALRRHMARTGTLSTGWLAAIGDERLARVLAAIHAEPFRQWRLSELTELACLSRTTLIDRFKRRLGMTPQGYATDLRMRAAQRALRKGETRVEAVALRAGYGSTAAFSRAFRRRTGQAPSSAR